MCNDAQLCPGPLPCPCPCTCCRASHLVEPLPLLGGRLRRLAQLVAGGGGGADRALPGLHLAHGEAHCGEVPQVSQSVGASACYCSGVGGGLWMLYAVLGSHDRKFTPPRALPASRCTALHAARAKPASAHAEACLWKSSVKAAAAAASTVPADRPCGPTVGTLSTRRPPPASCPGGSSSPRPRSAAGPGAAMVRGWPDGRVGWPCCTAEL